VSFANINLCVASQRVSIVVYFVIDSVRKLLITPHISVKLISFWKGRWHTLGERIRSRARKHGKVKYFCSSWWRWQIKYFQWIMGTRFSELHS